MKRFSLIGIILFFSFTGNAQTVVDGVVVEVVEGDILLVVLNSGDTISAKINNIECPEINQSFGDVAKSFTEKLCLKREITLAYDNYDKNLNFLAVVTLQKGKDLGAMLLEQGLAWHYAKGLSTHSNTSLYLNLEEKAKEKKKGLWKEPEQVPPWTFRNHHNKWEGKTSI